jgi:hypothetical protein
MGNAGPFEAFQRLQCRSPGALEIESLLRHFGSVPSAGTSCRNPLRFR